MSKLTIAEKMAAVKAIIFDNVIPAVPVAPVVAAAVDYPLQDGRTATIDKMEVGGMVTIDGAPAPDGDLILADGSSVTVAGGVITVVTPVAPVDAAAAAPAPLVTPTQLRADLQKFEDGAAPDQKALVVIVKALFESVFGWELRQTQEKILRDQAILTYQTGFTKQTEALKEMFSIMEEFGKESTAAPVEEEKKWEEMSTLERYRFNKQR